MISTRYAFCATRIIIDSIDNKVTAVDILDDLAAQGFPLFIPRLSFLWGLRRDPEDAAEFEAQVAVNIDDEQLHRFPLAVNFQGAVSSRALLTVGGLVIPRPGLVRVVFHSENTHDATFNFRAEAQPQVVPAQPAH